MDNAEGAAPAHGTASVRPRYGEVVTVEVERLAYGGEGVGRLAGAGSAAGMAVFVPKSAPGERVRVRLTEIARRHARGVLVDVESPGAARVPPVCSHYASGCGGCSWQHLSYGAQLAAKQDAVVDSLVRIGGYSAAEVAPLVAPILGAGAPFYYRNKMEFAFHARDGLGLHPEGRWRDVLAIHDCRLQSTLTMRIVAAARAFAEEHRLSAWDPVCHEGFLRELIIRQARGTGQTLVGLVTAPADFAQADAFVAALRAVDPSIVSIVWGVRSGLNDGAPIESATPLWGDGSITETVDGLSFRIGLHTFFQTNTEQARVMLDVVRKMVGAQVFAAANNGAFPRVVDVFCGVGFFTLALAREAKLAVGVEISAASIQVAQENARENNITNTAFYAGDARHALPVAIEAHGAPDVVVLDPPRSGAGGKVMRRIARTGAGRIVYVSCNPTTLARDLRELEPFGYRMEVVQPIDLFPQTYHVETIVALTRT